MGLASIKIKSDKNGIPHIALNGADITGQFSEFDLHFDGSGIPKATFKFEIGPLELDDIVLTPTFLEDKD